uniref:Uncharacterized protein n=1 Tax=Glossina austeni TaxID=7395 RepID=A0A1A9VM94_GLOAU
MKHEMIKSDDYNNEMYQTRYFVTHPLRRCLRTITIVVHIALHFAINSPRVVLSVASFVNPHKNKLVADNNEIILFGGALPELTALVTALTAEPLLLTALPDETLWKNAKHIV